MLRRLIWLALRIAAAIAVVVVPFGYAVTGVQTDVLIGAGCGLAIGVGVGLRGGSPRGPWTGILVGSIVGIAAALIAGAVPFTGWGALIPPILALAVGLIDGLGGASFSGYRDMIRETFILSVLLAVGLLPAATALGLPSFPLVSVILVPWVALIAGILSRHREGWRDARPPWLLVLAAVALVVLTIIQMMAEVRIPGISPIVAVLIQVLLATLALVALPAAAFLLGRAAITWLQPRLRVYGYLADYLRVMWVPIGGFAVGYLTRRAGFSQRQDARRHPPDPLGGLGAGVVRGGDVVHRAEAGPDRAPPRGGRSRIELRLVDMSRLTWLVVRIAAAVALVVVPFGYAITGVHPDVLMGVGCGLAVGVGVGLRGGTRGGPWTGILVGSIVGIAVALIAGSFSGNRWGLLGLPSLALAVGLIDGLGGSSLSGYRDVSRETFIMAVLLTLGFFPAQVAQDIFSHLRAEGVFSLHGASLVLPLLAMPWIALLVGLLSQRREGWRDTRPPRLLVLAAAGPPALLVYLLATGALEEGRGFSGIQLIVVIAYMLAVSVVALPAAAFLLGRTATTWLQPRLQVYGRLTDYLRVMWVPIGGFAVGYLTIIVLFAGFYGMLERFSPGAFADAGTRVTDWLSFAFFTAVAQDYNSIVPVSTNARMLVGAHLILSVGWALVLFAAVMSSIQPRLDRIARRHVEEAGE